MKIVFHTHALQRLIERGATEAEVIQTVLEGELFPAKFGRMGFRHNFSFEGMWHGRHYGNKQVEAYTVQENKNQLVITVIVKFF